MSCQFSFWDRTYTIGHYRVSLSRGRTYTIGHLFVMSVQFLGPHLYDRSISCQFESGPHLYDRPSLCLVSLNRGRTHIDRPFSYQFVFSLSRDCTHIDRSFILPIRSVRRPSLCFSMTFKATAPSIHIHWHCTSHLHGFALILVLLTLLPYAYRFIIAHDIVL